MSGVGIGVAMARDRPSDEGTSRSRRWFNWPLVLGLAVNFAAWASLAYWLLHRSK